MPKGVNTKAAQIAKYGSETAYRAEMSRRSALRKRVVLPFGGRGYFGKLKDEGREEEFKEIARRRKASSKGD